MQPTNNQQVGYNPELGPDQRAETGAEKGLYADVWDAADMDKMPEIDYNGNQVVANNEARAAAASDPNAELPPAEYDFTAMQDAAFNQMGGEAAPASQDLSELPTAPGEPFTETPDRASVVNQAIAEQVQTGGTAVDIDNVRDKVIGDIGTEGLKADNFADRQEIANQADMTAEDRKSREQEALQAAQNATSEVLAAEQMAVEAINQKATGDLGVSTSEITEKASRAESLADQASSMLSDSQAGSAEALVVNSISSQVKDKVEEIHTSLGEADALAEQVAEQVADIAAVAFLDGAEDAVGKAGDAFLRGRAIAEQHATVLEIDLVLERVDLLAVFRRDFFDLLCDGRDDLCGREVGTRRVGRCGGCRIHFEKVFQFDFAHDVPPCR